MIDVIFMVIDTTVLTEYPESPFVDVWNKENTIPASDTDVETSLYTKKIEINENKIISTVLVIVTDMSQVTNLLYSIFFLNVFRPIWSPQKNKNIPIVIRKNVFNSHSKSHLSL